MFLRGLGVIIDEAVKTCEIMTKISYGYITTCIITYLIGKQQQTIFISWENELVGDDYNTYDSISIYKYATESRFLIFSTEVVYSTYINPRDNDTWCYFDDARKHLNRL